MASEHTSYGIPFPPAPERFDRLEEQLAVITGLWRTPVGESFSCRGKHYQLVDAPALPKPVQVPPPIIVGGRAPSTLRSWPLGMPTSSTCPSSRGGDGPGVPAGCRGVRPDRTGRRRSATAGALGRGRGRHRPYRRGGATAGHPAARQERAAAGGSGVGSPARFVERLGEFSAIGASRIHLRLMDFNDLDHLELIAGEVLPQLWSVEADTRCGAKRGRRRLRLGRDPSWCGGLTGSGTVVDPRPRAGECRS